MRCCIPSYVVMLDIWKPDVRTTLHPELRLPATVVGGLVGQAPCHSRWAFGGAVPTVTCGRLGGARLGPRAWSRAGREAGRGGLQDVASGYAHIRVTCC